LAAILAADVAGYSRLVGADEEGTLAALRAHRDGLIDELIGQHSGRVANTAGDSILMEFPSAVEAVRCAIAIQQGMEVRNNDVSPEDRIEFRIGINVGDVIVQGDDLLGDGVNIAARLEGLSEPGGIALSSNAHEHIEGKVKSHFTDGGEHDVKNITRPVRVWRWRRNDDDELSSTTTSEAPLPLPDKPSIAVLPFTNMSGDPEQDYFADGITEDIITGLSKLPDLFVIARNSTFTYKGQSVAVSQVARDLGVRYVLEGSVRKAGNRLRITAQFIDGMAGDHLWAEKFDRDIDDIFELQDEITLNIISSIRIPIYTTEAQQTRQRNMPDLTTWDLVARANHRMLGFSQEGIEEARRLAGQILARDPESATAMTLIADCHTHDVFLGYSKDTERSLATALDLIQRAVSIDEESFFAHWVKGNLELWYLRRHSAAINEFNRSLELNPNFHLAISSLGVAQAYGGEPEKGIEQIERSIRADPRSSAMFFRFLQLAECHFIAGRYQEALDWSEKCLLRRGDYGNVLRLMTICQSHLGRTEEARATLQKWRGLFPTSTIADVIRPPYQNSADLERFLDGLRHAGLSEN
jgi:adenylate cyclase